MEILVTANGIEASLANGDPNAELHRVPYGPNHPLHPDVDVPGGFLLAPGVLSLCGLVRLAPERPLLGYDAKLKNMIWVGPAGRRVHYELHPQGDGRLGGAIRAEGAEEAAIEVSAVSIQKPGPTPGEPPSLDRTLPVTLRTGTVSLDSAGVTRAMRDAFCLSIGLDPAVMEETYGPRVSGAEAAWLAPNVIVHMLELTLPLAFPDLVPEQTSKTQRLIVGLGLHFHPGHDIALGEPLRYYLGYEQRARKGSLQRTASFRWEAWARNDTVRVASGTARGMERFG